MKIYLLHSFTVIGALLCVCSAADDPKANIEVTLVDEALAPLRGLEVVAVFPQSGKEWATYKFVKQSGQTNAEGMVRLSARTLLKPTIGAEPPNYYASGREVKLNVAEGGRNEDEWLPSPMRERLLLKRIIKPVPMYAVAKWPVVLPGKDAPFGFDLEKRDWVSPDGAGVKADLVFTLEKKEDNVLGNSATLRISFSNPNDGLIPLYELSGAESELKLPRIAPVEGYEAERKFTTDWSATRLPAAPIRTAAGYLYRVRTVLDEKGQMKNSWYGKIDGEFGWDVSNFPTAQVTFTYYLNPDSTPNLEFDRKRNLFAELPDEHLVKVP